MTVLLMTSLLRKLLEPKRVARNCSKLLETARRRTVSNSFMQLLVAENCSSSFLRRLVFKRTIIIPLDRISVDASGHIGTCPNASNGIRTWLQTSQSIRKRWENYEKWKTLRDSTLISQSHHFMIVSCLPHLSTHYFLPVPCWSA